LSGFLFALETAQGAKFDAGQNHRPHCVRLSVALSDHFGDLFTSRIDHRFGDVVSNFTPIGERAGFGNLHRAISGASA